MNFDRMSNDTRSPYYPGAEVLRRTGVRIDGKPAASNVSEACVSEGWVVYQKWSPKRKKHDLVRVDGVRVEFFERHNHKTNNPTEGDRLALEKAEEKRRRKAEKLRRLGL